MQNIFNSSHALLTIINDILDLSKIETGNLVLDTREFSLRRVMENAMNLVSNIAYAKGVELVYSTKPDFPDAVLTDETRFQQVMLNLLSSACLLLPHVDQCADAAKFTDKGEIVVTFQAAEKAATGYKVHFTVQDSGIGIPDNKKDKLFQLFSQVDNSSTRKYQVSTRTTSKTC